MSTLPRRSDPRPGLQAEVSPLQVDGLQVGFPQRDGTTVPVVRGVSFEVEAGEILGIVGESGCGKSLTALSLLGLAPAAARVLAGRVILGGADILAAGERDRRRLRGRVASMVFQEPLTSLDPVRTIADQVMEPLVIHRIARGASARLRAREMLELVGIPDADNRMREYPHQMSGGMRQRVMLAIALVCRPKLLIADEPTTALDVTIQAQILDLIDHIRRELGTAVVLITHNLGVVARICDRVAVMYAGQIVETAPTAELFRAPRHPYTRALLAASPFLKRHGARPDGLMPIPGQVPPLDALPQGCAFAPRCPEAHAACATEPPIAGALPDRWARCWVAAGG